MAEFVEENELQEGTYSQIDEVKQEQPQEIETPVEEPKQEVVPDKYKGKSLEDIVKMHQEAEKLIGRQAQEVHEVRNLADQLLKQQLDAKQQKQPESEPEEDFFVFEYICHSSGLIKVLAPPGKYLNFFGFDESEPKSLYVLNIKSNLS